MAAANLPTQTSPPPCARASRDPFLSSDPDRVATPSLPQFQPARAFSVAPTERPVVCASAPARPSRRTA